MSLKGTATLSDDDTFDTETDTFVITINDGCP